jgi:hypothetical protein
MNREEANALARSGRLHDLDDLRRALRAHGKSVQSPSGPVYRACQCSQCRRLRRELQFRLKQSPRSAAPSGD